MTTTQQRGTSEERDEPRLVATDTMVLAMRRLKLAQEARAEQLEREQRALEFQIPSRMWDADAREQRRKQVIDGVEVPARPMLSIPKLNQPVQLVLNQERAAHLGVHVSPLSEDASDDTAEVLRDLYRREEQRSRAGLARSWAFDRAVKAGTGCYRIDAEYDEESTNPFDQRVVWKRILHQDSVYFDPTAQEPDWSDGKWVFVLNWLPHSELVARYPQARLGAYESDELAALAEEAPEWVRLMSEEGDTEAAHLVAEYWRIETKPREWVILDDGSFAYADEIPEGRALHPDPKLRARRRKVDVPTVVWSLMTAVEEIDGPEEWNGKYIPIIPVIGVELQPVDGKRIWQGLYEPAMDGQRLFNYAASTAVELAALEPKSPYLMYEGQDLGYETMWAQANVRNFPALKVNPDARGPNGELLPLPQRAQADVGKLGPSMMLLEQADRFLQAATTSVDQTRIEQMGSRRVAHQTISALQEQSEAGNSHYLHNLATISMPYEAKVVIDLLAALYDRPGRVQRLLDLEDNERTVMLNAPFVIDPKTKRPVPFDGEHPPAFNATGAGDIAMQPDASGVYAPPPAGPGAAQRGPGAAQAPAPVVKHYDLKKGRYGVSVTIGKSWQTRLQHASEEIGRIIEASPELMPLIAPTYFKFRDFPGSKELAELMKKLRAKTHPGLDDDEDAEAQAVAKLQQVTQENEVLKQQLQAAGEKIQTDWAKHSAQVEVEKVKASLQRELKVLDNAGKLAVAEVQANIKGVQIAQQAEHEAMALQHTQSHELAMATAQADEARATAQQAFDQQRQLGAEGHQQALEQSDVAHRQSLEAGAMGHQQQMEAGEVEAQRAAEMQAAAGEGE